MVYIAYSNRDLTSVMRTAHAHVKGTDSTGHRYHSLNPELFYFQHATYVDTLFASIDIFHGGPHATRRNSCTANAACGTRSTTFPTAPSRRRTASSPSTSTTTAPRSSPGPRRRFVAPRGPAPAHLVPRKVPAAAIRAMLNPRAAQLLDVDVSVADRAALRAFATTTNLRLAMLPQKFRLIPSARHDPDD